MKKETDRFLSPSLKLTLFKIPYLFLPLSKKSSHRLYIGCNAYDIFVLKIQNSIPPSRKSISAWNESVCIFRTLFMLGCFVISYGLCPSEFRSNGLAPDSSRNSTSSKLLLVNFVHELCNGPQPLSSCALISAPAATSTLATSKCPFEQA